MPKISETYFKADRAEELDQMRREAREKKPRHCILYDCFHAKTDGSNVFCSKGRRLHATWGTRTLLVVLRGGASRVCQNCPDFAER